MTANQIAYEMTYVGKQSLRLQRKGERRFVRRFALWLVLTACFYAAVIWVIR